MRRFPTRKLLTIAVGASLSLVGAATLGLATASADTAPPPPPPPPVETPLASPLTPFLHQVGFTECVNGIGEGIGTGALTGGISTIEAGAAGALPGGIAGGIVGGIKNC